MPIAGQRTCHLREGGSPATVRMGGYRDPVNFLIAHSTSGEKLEQPGLTVLEDSPHLAGHEQPVHQPAAGHAVGHVVNRQVPSGASSKTCPWTHRLYGPCTCESSNLTGGSHSVIWLTHLTGIPRSRIL